MSIRFVKLGAMAAAAILACGVAQAGPYILAGTDADDHGFANAAGNQDGWLFMQRALENLAGSVTTGISKVTILGSTGEALIAASSAFDRSSLAGAGGWTRETVSVANFGTFFGAGGNLGTGILMMDSGQLGNGGNIGGGVNGSNFTAHASAIDNFLAAGGGLFSQANGYQWLTTLLPALTVTGEQNTGLALTAAGSAAFPGLNNGDLSAGPYHNRFNNVGAVGVLATSTVNQSNVILGGNLAGGSITNPGGNEVPAPSPLALLGAGLAALAWSRRRASK